MQSVELVGPVVELVVVQIGRPRRSSPGWTGYRLGRHQADLVLRWAIASVVVAAEAAVAAGAAAAVAAVAEHSRPAAVAEESSEPDGKTHDRSSSCLEWQP